MLILFTIQNNVMYKKFILTWSLNVDTLVRVLFFKIKMKHTAVLFKSEQNIKQELCFATNDKILRPCYFMVRRVDWNKLLHIHSYGIVCSRCISRKTLIKIHSMTFDVCNANCKQNNYLQ